MSVQIAAETLQPVQPVQEPAETVRTTETSKASTGVQAVDASHDPSWQREDFAWSEEVTFVTQALFGHQSLRLQQKAIINARTCWR